MIILEINTTRGYWEVAFNSIEMGLTKIEGLISHSAIFDSGSGYISAPSTDLEKIKS